MKTSKKEKTTKSRENIQRRLNRIRDEIGETIVVKMGIKERNKFDLLDIRCLGKSESEDVVDEEMVGGGLRPGYVG